MNDNKLGPPKVGALGKLVGTIITKLFGWKMVIDLPKDSKMVLVFAYHTTNWDLVHMLGGIYSCGLKPTWIGKEELFKGPFDWFYKALGGIPLNRHASTNMVDATVNTIKDNQQIMLGIAPEGTRALAKFWKSGFYHVAYKSQIPMHFAFLDYKKKVGGIKTGFIPTGDKTKDMAIIEELYKDIQAKYPHEVGPIKLKPYEYRK
ncbi:MAG: 1-acyl-sn-glycerol-3-phosphate acyltransferase [Chloroflexota bacterium]